MEDEMTKHTKQYAFAERVTRAKVIVEIYDGSVKPLKGAVIERQVVRARLDKAGVEYGQEVVIVPWGEVTIGQAIDLALRELMIGTAVGPESQFIKDWSSPER
jgi:hypothetical protein